MPVEQVNETRSNVIATIKRVAQTQHADFDYLLAQAKVESGLNPFARAQTSSAAGLYQFTSGTWLSIVGRHGEKAGLDAHAQALRSGQLNSHQREKLLALRHEPEVATTMAAHLAADNARSLAAAGYNNIGPTELYLAHFLGSSGAKTFLDGLTRTPGQAAATALPAAASSNTPIFFEGSRQRSYQEIYDRFAQKFTSPNQKATAIAVAASVAAIDLAERLRPKFATVLHDSVELNPQTKRIATAVRSALAPSTSTPTPPVATSSSTVPVSEEAMTRYLKNFELVDHSKGMASPGSHGSRDASQAADIPSNNEQMSVAQPNQLAVGANLVLKAVNPSLQQSDQI